MIRVTIILLIALLGLATTQRIRDTRILHPSFVLDWEGRTERFGASVYQVGDLDGDGVPDLAVGAPYYTTEDYPQQGNVVVLLLNSDGSVKSSLSVEAFVDIPKAVIPAMFGSSVTLISEGVLAIAAAGSGDIYVVTLGDGGSSVDSWEVIYGASNYNSALPAGQFAPALATLPDVDGDGYPELLVGTNRRILPQYDLDFNNDFLILFLNQNNRVRFTRSYLLPYDGPQRGFTVVNLGYAFEGGNIIAAISSPRYNLGRGLISFVRISTGSDTPSVQYDGELTADLLGIPTTRLNANFGSSVANAGDLNGDGVDDLIVEAFGVPYGIYLDRSGNSEASRLSVSRLCENCYSFGPIGDVDGDGTIDIAAGGNSGMDHEVVWILFMGDDVWNFTPGLIVALSILGFFTILSFAVCYFMCRDNVYV